jgi:hypothetical protein
MNMIYFNLCFLALILGVITPAHKNRWSPTILLFSLIGILLTVALGVSMYSITIKDTLLSLIDFGSLSARASLGFYMLSLLFVWGAVVQIKKHLLLLGKSSPRYKQA